MRLATRLSAFFLIALAVVLAGFSVRFTRWQGAIWFGSLTSGW